MKGKIVALLEAMSHSKNDEGLGQVYEKETDSENVIPKDSPLTMKQKIEGFKEFTKIMGDPSNATVGRVLILTSIAMIVIPVGILFLTMKIICPAIGCADAETISALAAVAAVVFVAAFYVLYALFWEEAPSFKKKGE